MLWIIIMHITLLGNIAPAAAAAKEEGAGRSKRKFWCLLSSR